MRRDTQGMTTTMWLYGVEKSTWKKLSYIKALEMKIILSDKVIESILDTPPMERNIYRLNDALKAKRLAQEMLLE